MAAQPWTHCDKPLPASWQRIHTDSAAVLAGYLLHACSAVGKADAVWLRTWQSSLLDVVRDIATPPAGMGNGQQGGSFPSARHFDWYEGHSWASGLQTWNDGKNQESSSEAVNGYFGVQLVGDAIGQHDLRVYGAILMAAEIKTAQVGLSH